jgi:hypothetical protein
MKRAEALVEIKAAGESLITGSSVRIICPFCEDKTEATMSVTRGVATLLYHCFRASCAKEGVIGGRIEKVGVISKEFKPKVFDKITSSGLSAPSLLYLSKYNISSVDIEENMIRWSSEQERVVLPLYTLLGYRWGTLTKSIYKDRKPKTILYRELDAPTIHFPYRTDIPGGSLVLVEDVISSIRVSHYTACAAILGTHLSEELVLHIKSLGFKEIRLMFDPDATAKALGYAKKYGGLLNFSVIQMSNGDPKDLTNEELNEIFLPNGHTLNTSN